AAEGAADASAGSSAKLREIDALVKQARFQEAHAQALLLLGEWDQTGEIPAAADLESLVHSFVMTVWNAGGTFSPAQDAALDRLLERVRDQVGETAPSYTRVLPKRASLVVFSGDYERARKILERALAIQEKVAGSIPVDLGETLTGLWDVARYENQ